MIIFHKRSRFERKISSIRTRSGSLASRERLCVRLDAIRMSGQMKWDSLLVFLARGVRRQLEAVGDHCVADQALDEVPVTIVRLGLARPLPVAAVVRVMAHRRRAVRVVSSGGTLPQRHPLPARPPRPGQEVQQLFLRSLEACVGVTLRGHRLAGALPLLRVVVQAIVFAVDPVGVHSPFVALQVFGNWNEECGR